MAATAPRRVATNDSEVSGQVSKLMQFVFDTHRNLSVSFEHQAYLALMDGWISVEDLNEIPLGIRTETKVLMRYLGRDKSSELNLEEEVH